MSFLSKLFGFGSREDHLAADLVRVSGEARDRWVEMYPTSPEQQLDIFFTLCIVNMHYVERFARSILGENAPPFIDAVWSRVQQLLIAPVSADPSLRSLAGVTQTTLTEGMESARQVDWQMPVPRSNKLEPATLSWAVGESIAAAAGRSDLREAINLGANLAIDCSNRLQVPRRLGVRA